MCQSFQCLYCLRRYSTPSSVSAFGDTHWEPDVLFWRLVPLVCENDSKTGGNVQEKEWKVH